MKQVIVNSPILAFYAPTKELTLVTDASDDGLGCVLTQEGRPVAFASRTLSSTDRNYAHIEKEILAALHGLEKSHHYTCGRHVHVVTDHKPRKYVRVFPSQKRCADSLSVYPTPVCIRTHKNDHVRTLKIL